MDETKLAIRITQHTLLGVPDGPYPLGHGNCFSVACDDGTEYRVVNFAFEDLEEAVRRGVSWPIKVKTLGGFHAVIHDERIPDDWYRDRWCETCCPERLLPVQQIHRHQRHEACGVREVIGGGIMMDFSKLPKLPEVK